MTKVSLHRDQVLPGARSEWSFEMARVSSERGCDGQFFKHVQPRRSERRLDVFECSAAVAHGTMSALGEKLKAFSYDPLYDPARWGLKESWDRAGRKSAQISRSSGRTGRKFENENSRRRKETGHRLDGRVDLFLRKPQHVSKDHHFVERAPTEGRTQSIPHDEPEPSDAGNVLGPAGSKRAKHFRRDIDPDAFDPGLPDMLDEPPGTRADLQSSALIDGISIQEIDAYLPEQVALGRPGISLPLSVHAIRVNVAEPGQSLGGPLRSLR